MCEPATMLMVASTAVSAVGSIQAGNAAAASSNYQAQVQNNNAIIARQRAKQEGEAGKIEAGRATRELAQIIGQQRANIGASGVTVSGSVADVIEDTAVQGSFDVALIRANSEQRVRDAAFDAQNADAQAGQLRARARSERRAGQLNALGSVLSAGASMAGGGMFGPGTKSSTKTKSFNTGGRGVRKSPLAGG